MHVRCPHCHHAIEIVGEVDLTRVTCVSCGSAFSLLPETLSYAPSFREIGHFELLETLGTGAFGTVWKARDTKLDRFVAIKIPRREQIADADTEMFMREARAAAQLKHPGIVSIHEVGQERGTLYIVSDLIHGTTLADRLTVGPFAPIDAAELCIKIADALHHAHQAGVIHRDLKPSNIMLDREGQPYLMDFGLAKREAGEITMTVDGKILGTAAYMSPEQAQGDGHHVDRRTDIYSLGVILFELLTGERPFRGNVRMLLHQAVHEDPPSPRKLNSRLSRDLETIVLKCLEKKSEKRFANAQEFGDELRRFVRGEPIRSRPIGRWRRVVRWCQRRPAVATLSGSLAAILLLLALLGPIVAIHQARLRQQAEQLVDEKTRLVGEIADSLQTQKRLTDEVETRRLQAERARRLSESHRFAAESQALRERAPVLALLLAREGVEITRRQGEGWTFRAASALRDALQQIGGVPLTGGNGIVRSSAFSPDDRWLVTSGVMAETVLWKTPQGNDGWGRHVVVTQDKGMSCAFFSPDNRYLASIDGPGDVVLWDLLSADPQNHGYLLPAQTGNGTCCAFSVDGRQFATGTTQGWVCRWDLAEGLPRSPAATVEGHLGIVRFVTFSGDGKWLATAGVDKVVRLWNGTGPESPAGGIVLQRGVALTQLRATNDGRWLAWSGADRNVYLCDLKADDIPGSRQSLHAFLQGSCSFTFSSDSRWLAAYAGDEIRVWDLTSPEGTVRSIALRGHMDEILDVAFSHHGKLLTSCGIDRTIRLWDMTNVDPSTSPRMLRGHDQGISSIAISQNGQWLVSGALDETLRCWDLSQPTAEGIRFRLSAPEGKPLTADLSSDGKCFVVRPNVSGAQPELYSLIGHPSDGPIAIPGVDMPIFDSAISPNGHWLGASVADNSVLLWEIRNGSPIGPITLGTLPSPVTMVEFSTDSRHLMASDIRGETVTWDLAQGSDRKSTRLIGLSPQPNQVKFNIVHEWLVSKSIFDWTLYRLKRSDTGALQATACTSLALAGDFAFRADGRWLAIADMDWQSGKSMRLWDLQRWIENGTFGEMVIGGSDSPMTAVEFSTDGDLLAFGQHNGTISVWNVNDPQQPESLAILGASSFMIKRLSFSDNGRRLWSLDARGDFCEWNLSIEELVERVATIVGRSFSEAELKQFQISGDPRREFELQAAAK